MLVHFPKVKCEDSFAMPQIEFGDNNVSGHVFLGLSTRKSMMWSLLSLPLEEPGTHIYMWVTWDASRQDLILGLAANIPAQALACFHVSSQNFCHQSPSSTTFNIIYK